MLSRHLTAIWGWMRAITLNPIVKLRAIHQTNKLKDIRTYTRGLKYSWAVNYWHDLQFKPHNFVTRIRTIKPAAALIGISSKLCINCNPPHTHTYCTPHLTRQHGPLNLSDISHYFTHYLSPRQNLVFIGKIKSQLLPLHCVVCASANGPWRSTCNHQKRISASRHNTLTPR